MNKQDVLDYLFNTKCQYCKMSLDLADIEYLEDEKGISVEGINYQTKIIIICPRCNNRQRMKYNE